MLQFFLYFLFGMEKWCVIVLISGINYPNAKLMRINMKREKYLNIIFRCLKKQMRPFTGMEIFQPRFGLCSRSF